MVMITRTPTTPAAINEDNSSMFSEKIIQQGFIVENVLAISESKASLNTSDGVIRFMSPIPTSDSFL